MELRKGMKVRSLVNQFDVNKGKEYVIREPSGNDVWVTDDAGDEFYLTADEFEAVTDSNGNRPKFAVGDRVRVVKDGYGEGGSRHGAKVGDVATLKEFTIGEFWRTDTYDFYNHEIEPVAAVVQQPQLTIQAGRYYKTRDGRKVGPMEEWSLGGWTAPKADRPFNGGVWEDDGSPRYDGAGDSPRLIAEWVDEPAVAEPKFKVGDRVEIVAGNDNKKRYIGTFFTIDNDEGDLNGEQCWSGRDHHSPYRYKESELRLVAPATSGKRTFKKGDRVRCLEDYPTQFTAGKIYTVRRNHNGGKYESVLVELDDNGSTSNGWNPDRFELVTSTSAIVALIENGQPKPATRPFVHPDREAAAKEARRLAGRHKGQEFGVYELVDTAREAKVYEHEWQRLTMDGKTWRAAKMLAAESGLEYEQARDAVFAWFAKQAA